MAGRAEDRGALRCYLDEIGSEPLATREEECELARRIRAGDHGALDRLVSANLRFVVALARRYGRPGIPLEELINEGNLGLIEAARRFDESRGVRFLSYAVWWIRQAILAALSREGHIVRVPDGRLELARRVSRVSRRLSQHLERAPNSREVAAELGLAEEQVREALGIVAADVSLDAPVRDDGSAGRHEFLPADTADPARDLESRDLARAVANRLRGLPPREAEVVGRYYGLEGYEPQTLAEIGRDLGVSAERARAVRDCGLGRLREGVAGRALRAFRAD